MIMKIIHRITGFILLLVVVVSGGALVVCARSGDSWSEFASVMIGNRIVVGGVGVALICLGLIFLLSAIPRRKQQKYLSFDGDGGTVSISTAAIAEYVARVAGEFPSIIKMKPEVIPARNNIDVHAYLQIKDGPDIHEVCELLQKRIREVLAGSLGINEVRKVEVSIKDIVAEFDPQ